MEEDQDFMFKFRLTDDSDSESLKETVYKCTECFKQFQQSKDLMAHLKKHLKTKDKYKCVDCSRTFNGNSNLRLHILRHLQLKPEECPYCDQRFYKTFDRDAHVKHKHWDKVSAGKPLTYKCGACGKIFKYPRSLVSHKKYQHGPGQFKCNVCGLTCKYRYILESHRLDCHKSKEPQQDLMANVKP